MGSERDVIILRIVAAACIVVRLGPGEEGHLIGDDLDAVALDVLVVGPAGVVDPAADHDLHALVDILLDRLADAVEAGDPVPFGVLEPAVVIVAEDLAGAVPLRARGGQAELGDVGAALGGAGFGGRADVAGEDDEILYGSRFLPSGPRDRPFD